LWFSDGSIVLRTSLPPQGSAESDNPQSPRRILYKVHKAVLALHARAFANLFHGNTSASDAASEQYDGLSVMDMPDPDEDVHWFLRAMYVPSPNPSPGSPKFGPVYASILRLATKYQAEELRKSMIEVFMAVWPTSLTRWSDNQSAYAALAKDIRHLNTLDIYNEDTEDMSLIYPDPAVALRLAVDCAIPNSVPSIYYDLFRLQASY
ncbi:hypothetical protein K488DRAFT_31277, partial [Vararia minispora EC-137]